MADQSTQTRTRWTAAVFLDNAQELQRRLAVWHVHDESEPVKVYSFLEVQGAIRQTFRSVVMCEGQGQRPEPGLQLFTGRVPKEITGQGFIGSGYCNLQSDIDKHLTRWLLRDFVEHSPDAGSGQDADYLRLKVDRILDAPIYCERPPAGSAEQFVLNEKNAKGDEGPYSFVGGQKVVSALLDDLVSAARALLARSVPVDEGPSQTNSDTDEPAEPGNQADDVAHSTDFRSVRWFGVVHKFSATQAACIKLLWRNWEQGTPDVGEQTILEAADSSSSRLRDVFEKGEHSAWGKMIVSASKGTFRLAETAKT